MSVIEQVRTASLQGYGADKVWKQMNREGIEEARCTVERLMRRLGLRGVRRGKVFRTTVSDCKEPCPLDKGSWQFRAERPNQLWVSDFTWSRPVRAGCTSPSLWTCSSDASSAGA